MSLKQFHVVFVSVSALLCAGLTAWGVRHGANWMVALASTGGIALVGYGRWFVRKGRTLDAR